MHKGAASPPRKSKRGSACHCELPYRSVVLEKTKVVQRHGGTRNVHIDGGTTGARSGLTSLDNEKQFFRRDSLTTLCDYFKSHRIAPRGARSDKKSVSIAIGMNALDRLFNVIALIIINRMVWIIVRRLLSPFSILDERIQKLGGQRA